MKIMTHFAIPAVLSVSLSGCFLDSGSKDETSATPTPTPPAVVNASLQVVHTALDAPNVNVKANGNTVIENLMFAQASDVLSLAPATYSVAVDAILPGEGNTATVVGPLDLALAEATRYTVFAVGSVAEQTLEPLVVTGTVNDVAAGKIRLQVVHAAATAPEVDIHVTAPNAELGSPLATLMYKDSTDYVEVDPGQYQVRIVHGSTLAGNVDIYVTATADITAATPAFAAVPFKAETGYVSLAAGDYVVTVTPAGSKTAAIGPVVLSLQANSIYTAIARDGVGLTADVGLILMDDFVQP